MNAQYVVTTIASRLNIDQTTAENVVGTMLSILQHEAGPQAMGGLLAKLPGSAELAQQYDVMARPSNGGLLGSLTSAFGSAIGEKAGALVNGMSQLEAAGLTLAQVRQAGTSLLEQAKVAGGAGAVASVLAAAPALANHFGA